MTKPLRKQATHMVRGCADEDMLTMCGKLAAPTDHDGGRIILTDWNGNRLLATTDRRAVTCRKCVNLLTIGALHVNTPHARKRIANRRTHGD